MASRVSPGNAASAKDDVLALAIARGMTRSKAAKMAGISERTCYARMATPTFRRLVDSHRKRLIDSAYGKLAKASGKAFDVLYKLLNNPDPKVQLAAARHIGRLVVSVGSFHDLAEQVEEIRESLKSRGHS